jgi:hypothetical protein
MSVNLNIYKSIIITHLKILKNGKVKFKAALRKHIHTYTLLLLYWCIFYVQRWSIILFCKMFVVFYIVEIVNVCVFISCSTSYCLCDKFMDPWICICMYVCYVCVYIYICMCACLCVCFYMYVCVCVCIMYVYMCVCVCMYVRMYWDKRCSGILMWLIQFIH